ncbi:hypothetical protein [Deinococcus alpinitundrae]|uniref:hypothetical protein n=1 Tax=Deinococcus alpinitundrae TaxID=468913 RepID=UPI00137B1662|nr:hypothetical protein [Deinococcus alpinitundrae]
MAPTRKVTNIPGVYAFEGKSYGPFSATNKKEFVEVPEAFAFTLNLPLHDSEELESEAEQGADIQELLDANHSLKEELDQARAQVADLQAKLKSTHEGAAQLGAARNALQAELESTRADFIRYQNDLPGLKARVMELELGALDQATVDLKSAVQNNTQAIKDITYDTSVVISPATTAPAESDVTGEPDKASKPAPAPKKAIKP